MELVSGTIIRLHGPLNLRLWDRIVVGVGAVIVLLAAPLAVAQENSASVVAFTGGCAVLALALRDRHAHMRHVWELAADADDPVEALALYEYLYRLRFRDLLVVADWRAQREAAGLPLVCDGPDAPEQVRALLAHLQAVPHEE